MISHFFTRPRAERGRLQHVSSSRKCASRGAFLCHRTHKKKKASVTF